MSCSAASSPQPSFAMSSPPASTTPSSPGPELPVQDSSSEPDTTIDETLINQLDVILEKSVIFSKVLRMRMESDKQAATSRALEETKTRSRLKRKRVAASRGKKKRRLDGDASGSDNEIVSATSKVGAGTDGTPTDEPPVFPQPALVTGVKMKKYQLEGLQWMIALHQNGISGILGDEMGLGKTLQTIAFCAYLRQETTKPFLIVCPLSVLHNWVEEFAKFAPSIPVCMYHGTPAERAELRRTVMVQHHEEDGVPKSAKASTSAKPGTTLLKPKSPAKIPAGRTKGKPQARRRSSRFTSSRRIVEAETEDSITDSDTEDDVKTADAVTKESTGNDKADDTRSRFPVVITTYEMIIKDRVHLAKYDWGYIIVDEGHRLKNLDCRLIKEIKKYSSAGRMILTGTPLHNNLAELWSLLNFILPEIFTSLDVFQDLFNLPEIDSMVGSEKASRIIQTLHAILKPFLLRRLKADVEFDLPPKKEYILYAPLSVWQRELYDKVLDGGLRLYLMGKDKDEDTSKVGDMASVEATKETCKKVDEGRRLRSSGHRKTGKKRKTYMMDGDNDEYFDMLERGDDDKEFKRVEREKELAQLGLQYQHQATAKQVNSMKLQNTVMQLRKVCSHPFLFDWPLDPKTHQPVLDESLVNASGKMMVLDRLLTELFKRKHKVLLFSQFTTMLDIIEDWVTEVKRWPFCRIDGSTPPMERRDQMNRFQQSGEGPDTPRLFLLSTRSGGLGINLTAADTVIFYDQDWNPQMDAQAQDRAHRIGQTKPVLIFRLVSAHTIETKIMQRATEKRKLEALVIAKGKFKKPAGELGPVKGGSMADMAAGLLKLEGEKINVVPSTEAGKASVLSDQDLEMLLDRSPEVFADRGKGWTSAGTVEVGDGDLEIEKDGKKAAFAVYEAPTDEGNGVLAKMLGEEVM